MNRLIKNTAWFHSLPKYRKFLLLLLVVINSCNGGNEQGAVTAIPDTAKQGTAPPEATTQQDNAATTQQDETASQADSFLIALKKERKVYVGDFDSMLKRRVIRVLVPYSRTLFFNDKGMESGVAANNFQEFEGFLNKKYYKKPFSIPFTVLFIPTARDQLIPGIMKGLGDIAAGNLTATEERMNLVDFITPKEVGRVSELVLTRRQDPGVTKLEELSGMTVYVRKSSSYYESLQNLNKMLATGGKTPVKLKIISENLEDEDLMEMLNAGIISTIIVDDWLARMWVQILPNIKVNDVSLRSEGYIGWAIRKNCPLLSAELNDFYFHYEKRLRSFPYRLKKYYGMVKHLQDPTESGSAKRYLEIIRLFEKYGKQYGFDPLMLAAMGFQESRLDQHERSAVGAIGVMQLMPATGSSMKVGDITITENNIHAGSKYMNLLMTKYFRDANFNLFNRSLFAFASYNAGPGRIAGLRKIAVERGLNPDIWLNSVEIIASEKIGLETTTYVRNITKYYCSYKLMLERSEEIKKTTVQ